MSGINILRRLLLTDAVKKSGQASGIMSIGDSVRKLADKRLQSYLLSAQKQGVDLDKLSEQEIKYMLELNKPKGPQIIPADSPEGKGITEMLLGKRGKVIKADFGKPFAEEVQKKDLNFIPIKANQYRDLFGKSPGVEEVVTVKRVITDIKKLEPIEAMKEANKVLKGEGRYKSLSKADREKIAGDESVTDHIFERNIEPDPEDFADGGVAGLLGERQNFSMGRRAFLKLMGAAGAGIGAAKAGLGSLFKAGKPVTKAAEVITTPNVAGKPAWFDAVVNRVIREGDDVTKQFAYKERMQVNTKQISPTEEVTIYRDLDDGSVRINYGAKMRIDETKPYEKGNISRASNDPDQVDLIVREGEVIEPSIEGPMKGKVGRKTESSFEAGEAEPRAVGGPEDADIEFDGERIVNNVDDLMQDVSTLEEFGTGKKLIGDKAAKAKKKREDYQKFTEDQMEQAEYLETKYGPYDDSAMDDFASGGLAKMLGE